MTGRYANAFGPHAPDATYIKHSYHEQLFDTGEVELNFVVAGNAEKPALLLVPGQTESWWGYERALPLLAEHFHTHAVDLRGQGRSTRTPGRYTLDNMGNDLVRFIDGVIRRPAIVSGLSSGGVLSAWLSAYAKPGQIRSAHYEDPPLFSSEVKISDARPIRAGRVFALWCKYLGDQWSVGDWDGLVAAVADEPGSSTALFGATGDQPPQNLKEYDPEWARAFLTGTVGVGCDHARMLASVKVPILLTRHSPVLALSDREVARVRELLAATGQPIDFRSFPTMPHSMHGQDPALFTNTLVEWAATLP